MTLYYALADRMGHLDDRDALSAFLQLSDEPGDPDWERINTALANLTRRFLKATASE